MMTQKAFFQEVTVMKRRTSKYHGHRSHSAARGVPRSIRFLLISVAVIVCIAIGAALGARPEKRRK